MKNFETSCPIDGTSALKPTFETSNVIAFPNRSASCVAATTPARPARVSSAQAVRFRALESDMVQSLRYGSARGRSFDRVKPWQAVLVGLVFSACSLASVFLAL